ncbi:acetylornithine deacetylase [Candidatus Albibeggiatoa sp. nov. NOAA]|uniref:acetylornithine deacetylase n=1 Tax=Candidatus Albibeggiatoa sp. nov. NOAA TaxID=3162724 RepID=UPI0032FB6D9A|nr:acetylornithine deacetylase [Thiotrichaceae bacterium]
MKFHNTIAMLDALIAAPSISCVNPKIDQSNREVINLLANWCQDLGFSCEILPIPNMPDKFNLIATLGHGEGGLVLSGHTDTVPYDLEQWDVDPFKLTEKDGLFYGLGTSDMKAFFALVLEAVKKFDPKQFKHPLILLATAEEESGMDGAKALLNTWKTGARHAVIGEPTNLRPIRMHKGIFMESIHLQGLAGHSSDPSLGNNALEGMHLVIAELIKWRQQLQSKYHNPLFQVPVPTLNLGHIHGGDNPNRICGGCELHIDLRPLPNMDIQELRGMLHQKVTQAVADTGLGVEFTALFDGIPAVETAQDAEIVKVTQKLTHHEAEAVAFATEAPYLQQLGIEPVVLGPGDIAQAHQPNEFINGQRLQPMTEVLVNLIRHFCL